MVVSAQEVAFVEMNLDDLTVGGESIMTHSDAEIARLTGVVNAFGQLQPIIVNRQGGSVIWGEEWVEALKLAHRQTAAVMVVDLDKESSELATIALRAPYGKKNTEVLTDKVIRLWMDGADIETCGLPIPEIEKLTGQRQPERRPRKCPKCGEVISKDQ